MVAPTEQQLANGARATFIYDSDARLTRLANLKSDSTVISSFDYTYDNAGARTAVLESNGDRVTWSYDEASRLTREQRSGLTQYDVTHTYDGAGNRLVRIADGSRTTYVYDSANQLVTSQDSSGVTTYTFDAAGNLAVEEAPGGRTTNTWDAENRLTLVQAPSSVINTMAYRADGLRVEKQDSSGTSRFIWDGENILQETDAANATVCQYTLQPLLHGHLVSQRRGNASRFYHFDALGSTR